MLRRDVLIHALCEDACTTEEEGPSGTVIAVRGCNGKLLFQFVPPRGGMFVWVSSTVLIIAKKKCTF